MDANLLDTKFAQMGARLKIADLLPGRNRATGVVSLDVQTDRKGEFFEITRQPGVEVEVAVLDVQPDDRHLLLLVREGKEKSKFLCGHDERHWFVAGIPEKAPVGNVRQAKESLKPAEVQTENYTFDQHEILSDQQRRLPRIYLEHDPPQEHRTDTRHWVDDPNVLLVHVTPFNALMWDSGRTPTRVIDHGVFVPAGTGYRGDIGRGIVVVNHLRQRGRRLGADLFERARTSIPLDLVGMDA
jgi:hypothetical protein